MCHSATVNIGAEQIKNVVAFSTSGPAFRSNLTGHNVFGVLEIPFMLSVLIPTCNHERALVPTLSTLVPGAADGLVRDVTIVDGGSTDATAEVADPAGLSQCAHRRGSAPPSAG
ncbi:glycosyltransferase, partial [Hansschlegelia beijingensis]